MRLILCLMILFLQQLASEQQEVSNQKNIEHNKTDNALTLYKDKCLASLRVKMPAGKNSHTFKVPASIDAQLRSGRSLLNSKPAPLHLTFELLPVYQVVRKKVCTRCQLFRVLSRYQASLRMMTCQPW